MKIEHLIFDLDNTLYPSTAKMDEGISRRMMECVQEFFKTDAETAKKIRSEHIANFSTTLEWLRSEGLTDVEGFLAHVHPQNEADELNDDENLKTYLESIKIPKMILTNAPREHAERVLNKLNVKDLFDSICDIRECSFLGKPYPSAFKKALSMCGGTIENTIFIDDMQKYVDGWKALGGNAVLVGNKNGKPLSEKSAAVLKDKNIIPGTIYKIPDIYGLKDLIKKLQES